MPLHINRTLIEYKTHVRQYLVLDTRSADSLPSHRVTRSECVCRSTYIYINCLTCIFFSSLIRDNCDTHMCCAAKRAISRTILSFLLLLLLRLHKHLAKTIANNNWILVFHRPIYKHGVRVQVQYSTAFKWFIIIVHSHRMYTNWTVNWTIFWGQTIEI